MATDHCGDLDQLLDSALDDFQSLNLTSASQRVDFDGRNGDGEGKKESSCRSSEVQGLGIALPDLKAKKKGKQKAAKEAKDSHVLEALDKLREQTRDAVKGLESVAGPRPGVENFGSDPMMEEWVKQFEELAGCQDMESIVETMMQQLLSKEILHEPMREIEPRYPKWLEDNKAKLSSEEYKRFRDQYELIRDLNQVYETEASNFNKLLSLCRKCKNVANHQTI